jgi:hypothetical protein
VSFLEDLFTASVVIVQHSNSFYDVLLDAEDDNERMRFIR